MRMGCGRRMRIATPRWKTITEVDRVAGGVWKFDFSVGYTGSGLPQSLDITGWRGPCLVATEARLDLRV